MAKLRAHTRGGELTLASSTQIPRKPISPELRADGAGLRSENDTLRLEKEALRARVDELERLNAELDRFVAVAAHDLSEPLRVVAGYASLLLDGTAGPLPDPARDFTARIESAVDRMQQLIDDLRRYSQIDARLEQTRVDIGNVLADALENLRVMIRERNAQIEVESDLPVVWGDRVQVVQLLQNLIGNAIKFGPPTNGLAEISAARTSDGWRVSVRDYGRGIAPEDQVRIFEPFRRLRGTGHLPGSGLGLAICRRIVTAHGGVIGVESRLGKGATFSFTLPDRPPDRADAPPAAPSAAAPG
jgi:signal transduction histidine kinase